MSLPLKLIENTQTAQGKNNLGSQNFENIL
jgi:hypothetical protein